MRKLFIFIISAIVVTTLFGCAENDELQEHVTYKQTRMLSGQSDNFKLTLNAGKRESPYCADGIQGDVLDYCIITLKPVDASLNCNDFSFSFTSDGHTFDGVLIKETFGNSYYKDLGKIAFGDVTAIVIKYNGTEETVQLEDRMADIPVDADEALRIASEEFKAEIQEESNDGFKREIYIKFINDPGTANSPYYWYVAFIKSRTEYWAMLIDPTSGEVIAKRS